MESAGTFFKRGYIVAGRYRIEEWLGQGGMGAVFRATHLRTKRRCALKVLLGHLANETEISATLDLEACVFARIGKNPHIVDVFDAGIDFRTGVAFLAMDLLEGETLDKFVKHHGPMPPKLLIVLWMQLADALSQAHGAGVVHRDIKPSNLFLTYDRKGNPQLCIVDFGIAKLLDEGVQRIVTPVGTPIYSAPEQLGPGARLLAAGQGYKVGLKITPATDTWALGVMTYEMLTGAPPGDLWFDRERGSSLDLVEQIAAQPTPSAMARAGKKAALLPQGFDAWLEWCLEKNTRDRPSIEAAVSQLVKLIDAAASPSETTASPAYVIVPKNEVLGPWGPYAPTKKLSESNVYSESAPQVDVVSFAGETTPDVNHRKPGQRAKVMTSAVVLAASAMATGLVYRGTLLNKQEEEQVQQPPQEPPLPLNPAKANHALPPNLINPNTHAASISSGAPKSPTLANEDKQANPSGPLAFLSIHAPTDCGVSLGGPGIGFAPIDNYSIPSGHEYVVIISCSEKKQYQKCWLNLKAEERQMLNFNEIDFHPADVIIKTVEPCSRWAIDPSL